MGMGRRAAHHTMMGAGWLRLAAVYTAFLAGLGHANEERVQIFRDEQQFVQAVASRHMQLSRFELTVENVLSASEIFSRDINLGDFADLRRELVCTFCRILPRLPAGISC